MPANPGKDSVRSTCHTINTNLYGGHNREKHKYSVRTYLSAFQFLERCTHNRMFTKRNDNYITPTSKNVVSSNFTTRPEFQRSNCVQL